MPIPQKIQDLANKVRTAIFGKDVREALAESIEETGEVTEETKLKQSVLEQQFHDVVKNATQVDPSSVALVAAQTNTETGENFPSISKRLDEENKRLNSSLTQTTKRIADKTFYNNLSVHKKPKPLITILDDDTRNELYTKMFPTIKELNIPITSAVVTGRIDKPNVGTITLAQYEEMRDTGLVEFISHTVSHQNLTGLSLTQAEQELADSKQWIIENGGNPDYFVPPFGGDNVEVKALIRKYYKSSFKTMSTGHVLTPPLNTYGIRRSDFEVDLETQKTRLDATLASNGWIIINTHAQYPTFTEENFRELIIYAKTIGLEFVTVGEGMKHFGNLVDFNSDSLSEDYSLVDVNGNPHGKIDSRFYVIGSSDVTSTLAPDSPKFKNGMNIAYFTSSLANSYGWPTSGMLLTFRATNISYSYQRFINNQGFVERHRYWTGTEWTNWLNVSGNERLASSQRTALVGVPIGYCVYDSTIQRPVWWTGTAWIRADGTPV